MKYFYTPILLLLKISPVLSQDFVESSLKEAISNSGLCLQTFDNYYANPSALADLKTINFQTTIKNFYQLEALFNKSVALGFPIPHQQAYTSIYYNSSGTSFFKTQNLGFGMGKRISKQLSIGANFYLMNQIIETWSSPISFGVSFGFLYTANDKINFSSIFRTSRKLTTLSFGLNYKLLEHLDFFLQIEKELKSNIEFRYGLIYSLNQRIKVAMGFSPLQSSMSMGAYFFLKDNLNLGVAFQKHFYLGYSPTATLKYLW